MIKKILITTILTLQAHFFVLAQDDCLALFKKATDKVRSMRLVGQKDNGFEMTCRIVVTAESGEISEDRMEITCLGSKYKYKTLETTLYQDDKTMVVIQPEQKSVFLTRPLPGKKRENQFAEMIKMQDSLQKHMVVKGCSREFGAVKAGEGYTKIVFVPSKELEGTGLKAITYWVEMQALDVTKIVVDYTPGSGYGIKKYEMIVDKMNTQSKVIPFKGDALSIALENGKPKPEFSTYQIIDKRN